MKISEWYRKRSATEKGSLISGAFLLIIALLTIAHQRSELSQENRDLLARLDEMKATVQKVTGERDNLKQRLAPFEAIAAKSFPNQLDRERMDLLIQSIQELNTKYGSFTLRRSDEMELKKKAAEFFAQFQAKNTNAPAITIYIYYAASDASHRFAEQLRSIFRDSNWDVAVEAGETMRLPLDRGLWIGRYSDIPKNPETFLFCINVFTSIGLDLKMLKFSKPPPDESRLYLIIHDPKYIR